MSQSMADAATFHKANHAAKLDRFMVAAGGEPNSEGKPVKIKVTFISLLAVGIDILAHLYF